jgi:hypothetical protein
MSMFQHLDDPLPLPDADLDRRQAVIARGTGLRRRRAAALGVPLTATAVVASAVWSLPLVLGPSQGDVVTPAAPPTPTLELQDPSLTGDPRSWSCGDVGDSAGEPDVRSFALDRPMYPLIHYHWDTGTLSSTEEVELRFEATSADGLRSRQLVARSIDGQVVEQFLRDPRTGARRDVPHDGDVTVHRAIGANFPGGSLAGLGGGWTFVASLSVNGTVVDSCDTAEAH